MSVMFNFCSEPTVQVGPWSCACVFKYEKAVCGEGESRTPLLKPARAWVGAGPVDQYLKPTVTPYVRGSSAMPKDQRPATVKAWVVVFSLARLRPKTRT